METFKGMLRGPGILRETDFQADIVWNSNCSAWSDSCPDGFSYRKFPMSRFNSEARENHPLPLYGEEAGQGMYQLIRKLYPICRSLTGDGVRETLRILQDYIPLAIENV